MSQDQVSGFWQHEGSEWLALCGDGEAFRLATAEVEWEHVGYGWSRVDDRILLADEEGDPAVSLPYRRHSEMGHDGRGAEVLELEVNGEWKTYRFLADAPLSMPLLDQLRHAGSPEALAKKLWTGEQHSGFSEAAVFEVSVLVIGSITAGVGLSKVAPVEESLVIAVALLPALAFLIYREHYSNSIEWWLQCPNGRKIGAVIYVAIALMSMLVGAANFFLDLPGPLAALSTLGQMLLLVGCGWTALRELRGRAKPRFEILPV